MSLSLFATPATARAAKEARAVAVLVGSYDGSGNYGDIAQFDAALELVRRLGPGLVVLPVLERAFLRGHLQHTAESSDDAPLAIFLGEQGEEVEDGLVPLPAPRELAFGACYLYGGGYLNSTWGERKLAMLDAADALLRAGGASPPFYVGSGLQVEPEWIEGRALTFGRFELLGARDGRSQAALAALGNGTTAIEACDDAIGLLRRLPPSDRASTNGDEVKLNLHFAEHEWMGQSPETVLGFYTRFVAELRRLVDRPVSIQPLIAYLDERIDERPAAERLRRACAELGAEVAEPLVLRPANLAEATRQLGKATMTLSCSYHVALTSLMLEVPTLMIGDNGYYAQKAAGLSEDFALPPIFTAASSADPEARAAAIVPMLLERTGKDELWRGLATGANGLRRRRASVEVALLGRIGGAALSALDARAADQAERLRERAAEPAQLQIQLAALETEREELRQRLEESPLEAELRAQEAEASAARAHAELATILSSRSWRLLSPLRRLRARLRRA